MSASRPYDDAGTALCPLLALSGHARMHCKCPLLGVKRTLVLQRCRTFPAPAWSASLP